MSTASGPLQITGTLVKDMLRKHPEIFTPEEREYAENFVNQAEIMKDVSPDDPTFGYGKSGVLFSNPKLKSLYMSMGKKLINQVYDDSGQDVDRFITAWRGVPHSKDPRYHNLVNRRIDEEIRRYS